MRKKTVTFNRETTPIGRNLTMRLAKFMAEAGVASRRQCEILITEGRVSVNGQPVLTPACNVDPRQDVIRCQGRTLSLEDKVYLMLNKPAGYTCSARDVHAVKLVYELIPNHFGRLFSIGRLDRDSEGLLLFTNDGDLAQNLTHPSREIEKRYLVTCIGRFSPDVRQHMLEGVYDDGDFLRPTAVECRAHDADQVVLEMTLTEGKKREIRRLCQALGLTVTALCRITFAQITLGNLISGHWRHLSADEIATLSQTPS